MKLKRITLLCLVALLTLSAACAGEQLTSEILPIEAEPKPLQRTEISTPQPESETELNLEYEWTEPHVADESDITEPEGPGSNGIIVAIDPGHQRQGNYRKEQNGPGSTVTKAMVAGGTKGVATGVPEYELTLAISLLLRDELIARGYEVFMIRETHEVDISNKTRAEMATEAGADIFVRVHANGSENSSSNGILTISPTSRSPYIPALYSRSLALSQCILDEMVASTGAKNMGIWETDTMTGINWSTMPVTIIELGYMTNPEEDRLMQTPEYQQKLVEGIANGIELFFIFEFGD